MRDELIALGVENWTKSDKLTFPSAEEKNRYESRLAAFIRCSQGLSVAKAAKEAGCSRSELYRLIGRSLKLDKKGMPYGHRILSKGVHAEVNRRNSESKKLSKKPLSGSFLLLLKTQPAIKEKIDDLVKENASPAKIYRDFKSECQKADLQKPAYPFNSRSEGRVSLGRYVRQLQDEEERKDATAEGARRDWASRAGGGDYFGPYKQGQLDGYWLDVDLELEYEGREPGSVVIIPVTRIWIIAVIEVGSTACLGYALDFSHNYSSDTVISAVRNATLPWKPRTSKSTIQYAPGDGFPSMHEELAYMCLDELHMDNANSQLSEMVRTTLHRKYRSVPMYGPGNTPNRRPHVEGSFSICERAGVKDWKSIGRISYDVLHHAIDAHWAAYNNSRAPGSTRTRMETLRDMVSAGGSMVRRIPLKEREELQRYDLVDYATVGRSEKTHVVRWIGARYYGAVLEEVKFGSPVLLQANSQDPREILVSCSKTGRKLGELLVERPWRARPVALHVRALLESDPQLRHLRSQGCDIIEALQAHVASKSRNEVEKRGKAAIARSFTPGSSSSAPPEDELATPNGNSQNSKHVPADAQTARPNATGSSPSAKSKHRQNQQTSHAFVRNLLQNIGVL